MEHNNLNINDVVLARYKTGQYVGKIIGWREADKAIIEVLAVLKHPRQGDLHNPNDIHVIFHQRKALAHHEKTIVNTHSLKKYTDDIPDYHQSLREAVDREVSELQESNTAWAKEALKQLEDLIVDYFN